MMFPGVAHKSRKRCINELNGFLILLTGLQMGCSLVTSRSQLPGRYLLGDATHHIILQMRADQSFTEHISYVSGAEAEYKGTWKWRDGRLYLNALQIPEEFIPKSIVAADKFRHPTFAELTYWSLSAERHFGRTVVPVFPDEDVSFEIQSQ